MLIAAVSRRLSSEQTLEWLAYATASIVISLTAIDPLKVLALARLLLPLLARLLPLLALQLV